MCGDSRVDEACLYQFFGDLDARRSTVNRKHLLVDVVGVAICGVVAGANGPDAIAVWAKSKKSWSEQFLKLPHRLTSKDCIRRALTALDSLAFQNRVQAWLEKLASISNLKFLGVDGNTTRNPPKIVDGGGDYVLPTKGNQPSLEAAVKAEFDAVQEEGLHCRKVSIIETTETAHGRKENRTYLLLDVPKTFPKWGNWTGLRTLRR